MDARLSDYPVFLSIKSGEATRIRKLVATALRAQWIEESGRFRLKAVKPPRDEGYAEFDRLYKEATKNRHDIFSLPTHDLYALAPGRSLRYGVNPTPFVSPLPANADKASGDSRQTCLVRRMAPGVFEIDSISSQVELSGLPSEISNLLKSDLPKQAWTAEQKTELGKIFNNPQSLSAAWKEPEVRDPMGTVMGRYLEPIAKLVGTDLVVALPDISVFAVLEAGGGKGTIEDALAKFSMCDSWTVSDGAAVARLSECEALNPSQAKRTVLAKYLRSTSSGGVAGISTLSDYVDNQRPGSSETWTDAMLLAMAGAVLDQEFVGDYPFNVRLYTKFNSDDWSHIKSGRPFTASALSALAQADLLDLLLHSRSRLEKSKQDPGFWQTLDFTKLTITATLEEKPVLIGFTMVGGEVYDVQQSAWNHDMRKKSLGHEPLYQPGMRQKLLLTIASPTNGEMVTTGFSEVKPGDSKPVVWSALPGQMAAEFKKALASRREPAFGGSQPPPPTS